MSELNHKALLEQISLLKKLPYTTAYTGSLGKLKASSYVHYSEVTKLLSDLRNEMAVAYKAHLEFKRITGWDTVEEWGSFQDGQEAQDKVIEEWIQEWDGKRNSRMGEVLYNKFMELKDKL